jgi:hypothetical protein
MREMEMPGDAQYYRRLWIDHALRVDAEPSDCSKIYYVVTVDLVKPYKHGERLIKFVKTTLGNPNLVSVSAASTLRLMTLWGREIHIPMANVARYDVMHYTVPLVEDDSRLDPSWVYSPSVMMYDASVGAWLAPSKDSHPEGLYANGVVMASLRQEVNGVLNITVMDYSSDPD